MGNGGLEEHEACSAGKGLRADQEGAERRAPAAVLMLTDGRQV
jgi:hypothetical protein